MQTFYQMPLKWKSLVMCQNEDKLFWYGRPANCKGGSSFIDSGKGLLGHLGTFGTRSGD
jgi:hypothetical protein